MGIIDKVRSSGNSTEGGEYTEIGDYVSIDEGDIAPAPDAGIQVHIAEISEQQDLLPIKDAVYDGDVVIADITHLRTNGPTIERAIGELRQAANEVGGDIIKIGDDEIVLTPSGVTISREKLTISVSE